MRRLFSNFSSGAPGLGLLLLRLAAGISLVAQGVSGLHVALTPGPTLLSLLLTGAGLLLLVGLWTPIAATMMAVFGLFRACLHPQNPWTYILLGILGAGLALLGPGAWSLDARFFGWKRIHISDR